MNNATIPRLTTLLTASVALAACASSTPGTGRTLPAPAAGVIAGIYQERAANGSGARPVANVTVGVFRQAFQPGTLQYSPPAPITRVRTDAGGRFSLVGLPPGRYWLVAIDAEAVPSGQWVTVSSQNGVRVTLFGCSDCPPLE